jgi:hypothetical protein
MNAQLQKFVYPQDAALLKASGEAENDKITVLLFSPEILGVVSENPAHRASYHMSQFIRQCVWQSWCASREHPEMHQVSVVQEQRSRGVVMVSAEYQKEHFELQFYGQESILNIEAFKGQLQSDVKSKSIRSPVYKLFEELMTMSSDTEADVANIILTMASISKLIVKQETGKEPVLAFLELSSCSKTDGAEDLTNASLQRYFSSLHMWKTVVDVINEAAESQGSVLPQAWKKASRGISMDRIKKQQSIGTYCVTLRDRPFILMALFSDLNFKS